MLILFLIFPIVGNATQDTCLSETKKIIEAPKTEIILDKHELYRLVANARRSAESIVAKELPGKARVWWNKNLNLYISEYKINSSTTIDLIYTRQGLTMSYLLKEGPKKVDYRCYYSDNSKVQK
ncbi:MAG: hypothetical protein ACXVCP_08015 [Bdellovibrio sp.]